MASTAIPTQAAVPPKAAAADIPAHAGLVLATLIIVAAVANLPLTMAVAVLVGAALVFFFPKHDKEKEMLAGYHKQHMAELMAKRGTE
jgi:hypothetical protein